MLRALIKAKLYYLQLEEIYLAFIVVNIFTNNVATFDPVTDEFLNVVVVYIRS